MELPFDFKEQMKVLLKDEYDKFIMQYDLPPTKGLRLNTLRAGDDVLNLMGLSLEKIPYEDAFYLDNNIKLGNHPFHQAGLFYIQEPSAMIPVASINMPDDAIVLDMCSAPGGKSSQIAARIPNGILVSNEVVPDRARILTENISRLGIKNCIVTSNHPTTLAKTMSNVFDFVVVDAPCSGEGMFRKEQVAINEWYKELTSNNAVRQLEILESAKQCVKNGGCIVYSTCTFNLAENEGVVKAFLSQNEDFEILNVDERILLYTTAGVGVDKARRFYPHIAKGEGQFVAILHKKGESTQRAKSLKSKINQSDNKIISDFLNKYTNLKQYYLYKFGDQYFITEKELLDVYKLNVFHYGVCLGTIEKNRLIPSHNFFLAYGDDFKNCVDFNLQEDKLLQYVKGEEIELSCDFEGFCVVKCNGYTIGGGKVVADRLKNYYPKKLRQQVKLNIK